MQAHPMTPVCRFDTSCSRVDCYFAHPNGRLIDGSSAMVMCLPGSTNGLGIPHSMSVAAANSDGQLKACRFGWECHRPDCYFFHPNGRRMDAGGVFINPMSGLVRSYSALSASSAASCGGVSDLVRESEQELMDTWFPKARHCTCCKGFIHGCSGEICTSLGKCTCSIEESDMEIPPGINEPVQNGSAAANP